MYHGEVLVVREPIPGGSRGIVGVQRMIDPPPFTALYTHMYTVINTLCDTIYTLYSIIQTMSNVIHTIYNMIHTLCMYVAMENVDM